MATTEAEDTLSRIAERLHRPVASLPALAALDPRAQAALLAAIERGLEQRHQDLDRALGRFLPGPLRRWLRR